MIKGSILADYKYKKVIVLLGARQVGKTTLLSELQEGANKVLSLNCDNVDDVLSLEGKSSTGLQYLLSPYDLVFIDEAQRVKNIGLTLKMIGDLKMATQVVVTGSSSLDMAEEINEPATGRLIEYNLFPFSLTELAANTSEREENRLLESRMIYGLYPEVVTEQGNAKRTLMTLTNTYLYKDIFAYKGITVPTVILTDMNSVSCSELTVMGIRNLPAGNGIQIGKTTYGGNGKLTYNAVENGGQFSTVVMFNGLTPEYQQIKLVYTSSEMTKAAFDGKCYEGKGIPPNMDVALDIVKYQDGTDTQLERAVQYITTGN